MYKDSILNLYRYFYSHFGVLKYLKSFCYQNIGEIAFKRSKSSTYVPWIASAQYVNKYINMASIQEATPTATPLLQNALFVFTKTKVRNII